MAKQHYTPAEVDALLGERFRGARCCLTLPGRDPVYGIVSNIALDPRREQLRERLINIQINGHDSLFVCSLECLHECLVVTSPKQQAAP